MSLRGFRGSSRFWQGRMMSIRAGHYAVPVDPLTPVTTLFGWSRKRSLEVFDRFSLLFRRGVQRSFMRSCRICRFRFGAIRTHRHAKPMDQDLWQTAGTSRHRLLVSARSERQRNLHPFDDNGRRTPERSRLHYDEPAHRERPHPNA